MNTIASLSIYFKSRMITTVCMLMVSLGYGSYLSFMERYNMSQILTLFLLCMWREIDSIDDVYQDAFQQQGRLDIGDTEIIFTYPSSVLFSISDISKCNYRVIKYKLSGMKSDYVFAFEKAMSLFEIGENKCIEIY